MKQTIITGTNTLLKMAETLKERGIISTKQFAEMLIRNRNLSKEEQYDKVMFN